ncbi:hypothetical protein NKH85_12605 [Mesorhizobium sp. M0924]|uniref:hypothetical protein n=1 Tax=unclassified Mesorhizobium TaxID=325217 RepID=UPI0033358B75
MADSDHSTTTPSVIHGRGPKDSVRSCDPDPAILLLRDWLRAQHVSQVLCRLQQRLERRILDSAGPEITDGRVGYSIACQAEVEATTAALKLQDKLPHIVARTLLGVVAKLEIIAGADRDIDDPTDFPWPHIASVLDDLKKIAGSPPLERPERSVVQAYCRRYQAIATEMIDLEKQAGNHRLGRGSALSINTEKRNKLTP